MLNINKHRSTISATGWKLVDLLLLLIYCLCFWTDMTLYSFLTFSMSVMISFIFIFIIIIIIIVIIILYISFISITMQNLEVVAWKLTELWPFQLFSKKTVTRLLTYLLSYLVTYRRTYTIRWSRIKRMGHSFEPPWYISVSTFKTLDLLTFVFILIK